MSYESETDKAYALIDAGEHEAAFNIFSDLWLAGGRGAILGMAEAKQAAGDDQQRLAIVDMGLAGFNNEYPLDDVSLCLVQFHAIPVLWPRTSDENYFPDPREAVSTRIELLTLLSECLPEGLPEPEADFLALKTISNLADNVLYSLGTLKVLELQIFASSKLLNCARNEYRVLAAKNLHSFFSANPPRTVGALLAMNSSDYEFAKPLETSLEQFGQLEDMASNLATQIVSTADALEVDAAFDDRLAKPEPGFYVFQAAMMDYLASDRADQTDPKIVAMHDKYRPSF